MFQPFALTARAKVNLALHVLGRRPDGFHELDSIVAFADLGDELRFSPGEVFGIAASGPFAGSLPSMGGNIITAAFQAAKDIAARRGKGLPPVTVHLVKNLPVASGIGGGSADAAEALRGFLRIAGIDALDDEIMSSALSLGADVPVCLTGKACRMQGIGERITLLPAFRPVYALLVNPGVAVSTPSVFRKFGLENGRALGQPIADPFDPAHWRNDLTAPAVALSPVISDVIESLRALPGVSRAVMSGSGATCAAMFESRDAAAAAQRDLRRHRSDWWIEAAKLG